MNDRELLELAATAAGIDTSKVGAISGLYLGVYGWWNPLTDDGDALRLAVKLGIVVDPCHGIVMVHDADFDISPNDIDATRRAIVRAAAAAAAEIGKETE